MIELLKLRRKGTILSDWGKGIIVPLKKKTRGKWGIMKTFCYYARLIRRDSKE